MSADNKDLPLANGGKIAPSYYDPIAGKYERLYGAGGAAYMKDKDTHEELQLVREEVKTVKTELQTIKTILNSFIG